MKLKITQEVARPKGHWQVKKWNLLKGESEDTAEVINKDNLITDHLISMFLMTSVNETSFNKWLQFSNETPTVESTEASSIADKLLGGNGVPYFFPSGASGSNVGKEVKGIFNTYGNNSNSIIVMWLHLDQPLLIEEGDVLKVSYTLSPSNLGIVTTSGTIPYKTYVFGEDPEDPNAGTLVDNIDFTVSYNFAQSTRVTGPYVPVKNPDGSMSFGTDLNFKYTSGVRAISLPAETISSAACTANTGNGSRTLNVTFPNTKPVREPGSYLEVEIDFNVRVLPHE